MKSRRTLTSLLAMLCLATLLLSGCSRKGVHMSKHRKQRRCNCPTFSEATPAAPDNAILYGTDSGTI